MIYESPEPQRAGTAAATLAMIATFAFFAFVALPYGLQREAHRQAVVKAMTCKHYPHGGCR